MNGPINGPIDRIQRSGTKYVRVEPDGDATVSQSLEIAGPRPWADVRAYGATGDGSTDDTQAFADALAAVDSAGGGMVLVPPGTYIVAGTSGGAAITIPGDNIELVGAGRAVTVIKAKDATDFLHVVYATGKTGIAVRGLTVDGNAANRYADMTTVMTGIFLTGCSDSIIEDCVARDVWGAIGGGSGNLIAFGGGGARNRISNCVAIGGGRRTVTDAGISNGDATLTSATAAFTAADVGANIYVAGAGAAGAILSTTIASVTNATTVELDDAASATVSNAAVNITCRPADGFYVSSDQTIIEGCHAENIGDTAYAIASCNESVIANCTAKGIASAGAIANTEAASTKRGGMITGLTAVDWGPANTGGICLGAIYPGASPNTAQLLDTLLSGISMVQTIANWNGPAINCNNTTTGASTGTTDGLTIRDIHIRGAGTQGILVFGTRILIDGVAVYGPGGNAIQVQAGSDTVTIENFHVESAQSVGIAVTSSTDVTVRNGTVRKTGGTMTYGVYFYDTNTRARVLNVRVPDVSFAQVGSDGGTTPTVINVPLGSVSGFTFGKGETGVIRASATEVELGSLTDIPLVILQNGVEVARFNADGVLALAQAASKIIPGTTSLALRNNADSADNLLLTDAGLATIRAGLRLGGLTSPNLTAVNQQLATNGDHNTGIGGHGFLFLMEKQTFGSYGLFARHPATMISAGSSGVSWSATKDNASTINVYYDSGGTNTWHIQNKTASTITVNGLILTSS